ncbi:hypothetical protein QMO14_33050 [Variovorax sp. CAN2819]|uniref:hypothetical protein n=1 Tax=Variovorax sp. CAN15 TaxID=3046727 RepID=UPI00264A2B9F|nr:hypothetical protein [Variovorax sp. CAN15]MDN6888408.1 hypothetical protein [Variovorax sp. CAN15]
MVGNNFDAVASSIASMLPRERWHTHPSAKGTLRLRASDISENVEHSLVLTEPFSAVDEPGGPWLTLSCQFNICFPRVEKHIANALGWTAPSPLSAALRFVQMVPDSFLYAGGAFLVDLSSPTARQASELKFSELILEYMEPVRQLVSQEGCLGDPLFYPHDSVSPLSWELRRAPYLFLEGSRQRFDSYAENLLHRLDEYEQGLADDKSGVDQQAVAARRSITELRQLIRVLRAAPA